jgi:hypothetical protein
MDPLPSLPYPFPSVSLTRVLLVLLHFPVVETAVRVWLNAVGGHPWSSRREDSAGGSGLPLPRSRYRSEFCVSELACEMHLRETRRPLTRDGQGEAPTAWHLARFPPLWRTVLLNVFDVLLESLIFRQINSHTSTAIAGRPC